MSSSFIATRGRALTFLFVATAVFMAATTVSFGESASPSDTTVAVQTERDYLPLAVGNRWELRSASAPDAMVMEVTGRDGDAYLIRWVNPFVKATFRVRDEGGRIVLVGLDMGQGLAPIPDSVYWEFSRGKGEQWDAPVGRGQISAHGITVDTPAGQFRDAIEVRTIDQQGQSMYWTFAPDTGFVRWGQGQSAYLLTSFQQGTRSSGAPPAPVGVTVQPGSPAVDDRQRILIGLDANPHDKHGNGRTGKRNALRQARDAGMTLLHSAPKWNEFEKSPGRFDLSDDADVIGEFAVEHNLPIALNFRVIDTNQRSMPSDYEKWRFDEERLADRLRAALRAFPQAYKRQTTLLAIGNEVDGYFSSRPDEVAPYAQLLRRVMDTARQEFPNARLSVNFTFGAIGDMNRFRALAELSEFASFTYYPLNADFTMRDPSGLRGDVRRMLDAAGGRPLYIQEIGYASADRLNSSEPKQAEFYANAFAALREHDGRIVGATFLFMSDLSQFVVDNLGLYYRLPNSDNFKAYLRTLGLLERDGTAKPAWDVFRRETLALKAGR